MIHGLPECATVNVRPLRMNVGHQMKWDCMAGCYGLIATVCRAFANNLDCHSPVILITRHVIG